MKDSYRALVLCNLLHAVGNPEVRQSDPIILFNLIPVEDKSNSTAKESPKQWVSWGIQSTKEAVPLNIVWSSVPSERNVPSVVSFANTAREVDESGIHSPPESP